MRRFVFVLILSTMCGCHSCDKQKESQSTTVEAEPSAKPGHHANERAPGLRPKIHTAPIGQPLFHNADAGATPRVEGVDAAR